jgi:hypothetical protein
MPTRDWIQLRVRVPSDLHREIEREAMRLGSTVQRELLTRVLRGSRKDARPVTTARAYAQVKGELDVAKKLTESLQAVIEQMHSAAESASEDEPEPPEDDEEEGGDNAR